MLIHGTRHEAIEVGEWVVIPGYHFSVKLIFDRLSVPFSILSFVLCGTVAAFAVRYMHHERRYNRFFALYAMFVIGMVLASLAGTIETLFAGWELVGLSSALLVAFFQERPAPARNGLRVWVVYRVSDAALLVAALVLHHLSGQGDFDQMMGHGLWPEGHTVVAGNSALIVGLLLILAAAGKSALVPFSGWLPRAMEGPTPSSAIFYGALSVHLGVFLLLRVSPILETSLVLQIVVVVLGLTTALYAYVIGTVQTDIKSALGNALLCVTPLAGVYAAVRLALPIAPDWVLGWIGLVSLVTAVYAAGMAVVQREARRFFAYLFLGHASLVLVGLELHTSVSLTGALALWVSVALSLGGFGLTLRALEARFGRLSLADFHGLYDHSPALAVCFLLTGLASVGFPGTLGFVATELLVAGVIEANPYLGLAVAVAAAINGIAVVRAYFLLFTGARHSSTVSLNIGVRERIAVLTLAALILGGGFFPQPGVASRHRAAVAILEERSGDSRQKGEAVVRSP